MPDARVAASTNSLGRPLRSPPMITHRRDIGSWRNSDIGGKNFKIQEPQNQNEYQLRFGSSVPGSFLPLPQPLAFFVAPAAGIGIDFDITGGTGLPGPVLLHARRNQLSPSRFVLPIG